MATRLTFKTYLKNRRATDTPAGDFTKDAVEDANMPDVASWPQLQAYLFQRNAVREAILAAKIVWRGYESALKRNSH